MGNSPSHHPDASAPSADSIPPTGSPPVPDPLTPDILLNFVQDAVIGTDLTFHITSWNPGAEVLYGWSAAEVLGQTVGAVLQTQYFDDTPDHVRAQFQAAGTWRGEVRQQHRDGQTLTIMASVALVRSPTGEPLGAVSVNRDISERKAAEQSRQRAADRLHILVEASRAFAEAGTDSQALLDQVAQLTAERLTAACTVRLLSADAHWLDICAVSHTRPAERAALLTPTRLSVDASHPTALAVRSGQPQLIPTIDPEELRASALPEQQAFPPLFSPRSQLTVPLRVHGKAIGSLACARFDPDQAPFDEDDLRLTQDLADRAALAISNARLIEEVQAAREVADEARARLDTLITSLPTGIGYLDHELRYQMVNPALAALNGCTPTEHVGRTMTEIIPHLAPRLEPPVRQVLSTGAAVRDLELHGQPCPIDCTAHDWLISFFPVHNTARVITGVGVTVTDVTVITQTTAALRETERKLTTLFEILPVGVSIFDASGTVVAMNPAQEEIFRRQQGGVASTGVLDRPFLRPDGTPRPREELATARALRERQPALEVESGFVSATGETHWITASAVPVEFPDWRVVAVASDITARVQAEEARHASEARYHILFETMVQGVVVYDADRRPTMANPAAARILGLSQEDILASGELRDGWPVIHEDGAPYRYAEYPAAIALQTGQEVRDAVMGLIRPDSGAISWIRVQAVPQIAPGERQPTLVYTILEDITAQRAAQRALEQERQQLAAILNTMHEGVIAARPDGSIALINPAALAMRDLDPAHLPATLAELVQSTPQQAVDPDGRPLPLERLPMRRVLQGEQFVGLELELRSRRDDQVRWHSFNGAPVYDQKGTLILGVITGQDITDGKGVEAQLHAVLAAEQVARLAAEAASERTGRLQAITAELAATLSWETVIAVMTGHVGVASGAANVIVWLLDTDGRQLTATGWSEGSTIERATLQTLPLTTRSPMTAAIHDQAPVWLHSRDEAEALFPGFGAVMTDQGDQAFASVPLRTADHILGTLSFGYAAPHAFAPDDQAFLYTLAQQGAQALEHVRLYHQVLESHDRLQTLGERLVAVQEEERQHLARELHDEIGQTLTGLSLLLSTGPSLSPDLLYAQLDQAQRQVTTLIAQVRQRSLDLRPSILDDLGLQVTLTWFFARYTEQTGIQLTVQLHGLEQRFPPSVELTAYRIIQEALTNVARHAGIDHARVAVWVSSTNVLINITDTGRGFDVTAAWRAHHSSGLTSMRERAVLLGGDLTINAEPGVGTNVLAILPLGRPSAGLEEIP